MEEPQRVIEPEIVSPHELPFRSSTPPFEFRIKRLPLGWSLLAVPLLILLFLKLVLVMVVVGVAGFFAWGIVRFIRTGRRWLRRA